MDDLCRSIGSGPAPPPQNGYALPAALPVIMSAPPSRCAQRAIRPFHISMTPRCFSTSHALFGSRAEMLGNFPRPCTGVARPLRPPLESKLQGVTGPGARGSYQAGASAVCGPAHLVAAHQQRLRAATAVQRPQVLRCAGACSYPSHTNPAFIAAIWSWCAADCSGDARQRRGRRRQRPCCRRGGCPPLSSREARCAAAAAAGGAAGQGQPGECGSIR